MNKLTSACWRGVWSPISGLRVGRGFGKESDQVHPSLWLPVSPLTVVRAGQRKCQQLTGPLLFTTFILKGPSQDSLSLSSSVGLNLMFLDLHLIYSRVLFTLPLVGFKLVA